MSDTPTFLSVEEARAHILADLPDPGTERVSTLNACGRTLARPAIARQDIPGFDNSSRDGFALRWKDLEPLHTPSVLRVVTTVYAGDVPEVELSDHEAARIMTGAMIPKGADVVIMQEDCEVDEDTVIVPQPEAHERGQWIRRRGRFIQADAPLLGAGAVVGPGELAALLSQGILFVDVARKPRVAIVSTGDELVEPGEPVTGGKIVNSNAHMLAALVQQAGGVPVVLPIAPDTREAVMDAYDEAIQGADLVLSSGGVSVGAHDHTRPVIEELCGEVAFWKIRMKPGKPLAFGRYEDEARMVPLIGLPGNPVSSFVGFHQFVRPALDAMMGRDVSEEDTPPTIHATITRDVRSPSLRREYLTGTLEHTAEGARFTPAEDQDSGNLAILCGVNALGIVEEGVKALAVGDAIKVELLPAP